jgi:hypothetical protein
MADKFGFRSAATEKAIRENEERIKKGLASVKGKRGRRVKNPYTKNADNILAKLKNAKA